MVHITFPPKLASQVGLWHFQLVEVSRDCFSLTRLFAEIERRHSITQHREGTKLIKMLIMEENTLLRGQTVWLRKGKILFLRRHASLQNWMPPAGSNNCSWLPAENNNNRPLWQWVTYAVAPRAILMELESTRERWQFSCLIMEARRSAESVSCFVRFDHYSARRVSPFVSVIKSGNQGPFSLFWCARLRARRPGPRKEPLILVKRAQEFLLVLYCYMEVFVLMEIAGISKRSSGSLPN